MDYSNSTSLNDLRMMKLKAVTDKCQISRSTIYDKLDSKSKRYDPEFPKPRKLGQNSVAWIEEEVNTWIRTRLT
ncbi:MAG: AlpA family transcriptional regulator [Acinetobacter sp. 39-4]|jgi:prophage regulatory protein|uniref:helix-turn-helix transcriptional regulator n=2 Tax=Acinetobacter modestus TaxID=1776740 RepID=UPI00095A57D2|nr:MAG: AlpA family transcriptional regulator [Acinetobacter sp. 39-4]